MLGNLLVIFFGTLLSFFIFWKRLREDYSSEIIFNSAFIILTGFFAGFWISLKFFHNWFFWTSFLGAIAGLLVSMYRNKIRFYESLEALVFSLIPTLSLFFLFDAVQNSSLFSFVAFIFTLLLTFVFYYVDVHYKDFGWYHSGKIGLSGLSVLFTMFLVRSIVASLVPSVLSFSGKVESFISGFGVLISGGMIYLLGRNQK